MFYNDDVIEPIGLGYLYLCVYVLCAYLLSLYANLVAIYDIMCSYQLLDALI